MHRADDNFEGDDPALQGFLTLLARDMQDHPESISALSPALVGRIAGLIGGTAVDADERIEGEVAL